MNHATHGVLIKHSICHENLFLLVLNKNMSVSNSDKMKFKLLITNVVSFY